MSSKMTDKEAFQLNKRALGIWWKYEPKMFLSTLIVSVTGAFIPFVGIYLSARIINELAGARNPERIGGLVIMTLLTTTMLSLIQAALERWKSSHRNGTYYKEYKIYFDKILSMDYEDLENNHTYDLISRIDQNKQWTGRGLGKLIGNFESFVTAIIRIIGAVSLTISLFTLQIPESAGVVTILNNPLFLVGILALMIAVTVAAPSLSVKADSYWAKCDEEARMGNRVFSFYGFMAYDRRRAVDVRVYRQEKLCSQYFHQCNAFGSESKIGRYARGPMGFLSALSAALSYVFTAVVMIFVCFKAWGGAFGIGSVTQYISSITALSGGVSQLISTVGDMKNNASFLRTTFEFLDIPNKMYQGSLTVEKRSDRNYEIEFRDVSFRYPGSDLWALRHVSMKFKVGERLAVVGQNGSGKTTFIKLLCRLYDPTEGAILLNGIDIRKYNYKEYLSVFSVVFQDFKLLAFPVGENVAADSEVDRDRAKRCLSVAGFDAKLAAMEQGMDTYLYKNLEKTGVEVSGGEEQKIAIARALYKDAPFIILDEPTAALDPVSEYEIYSRFNELVEDKTAIYISHRLSSCRFCDEIAVFDHGNVIQKGTHEDLLTEKEGKYYELWEAQAQYYTAG